MNKYPSGDENKRISTHLRIHFIDSITMLSTEGKTFGKLSNKTTESTGNSDSDFDVKKKRFISCDPRVVI